MHRTSVPTSQRAVKGRYRGLQFDDDGKNRVWCQKRIKHELLGQVQFRNVRAGGTCTIVDSREQLGLQQWWPKGRGIRPLEVCGQEPMKPS